MQTKIPCVIMRGGTSRGPFFKLSDLPADVPTRDAVLLSVMGSPHEIQVDGIGGSHSVTSKVAMISKSQAPGRGRRLPVRAGADPRELRRYQAQLRQHAGRGRAVRDRGRAGSGARTARRRCASTTSTPTRSSRRSCRRRAARSPMKATRRSTACRARRRRSGSISRSAIGAVTGKMLPTGRPLDVIDGVEVSCVDIAMPLVMMRADDIGKTGYETAGRARRGPRAHGAHGSDPPQGGRADGHGRRVEERRAEDWHCSPKPRNGGTISSRYFVPETCHKSHPVTGTVCIASACAIPGTLAAQIAPLPPAPQGMVRIEHPSGMILIDLDADFSDGRQESAPRRADPHRAPHLRRQRVRPREGVGGQRAASRRRAIGSSADGSLGCTDDAMNVAVIGGGYAGMAAAVTLAEGSVPVTVYEAGRTLGGRARRIEHPALAAGSWLDNGLHILIGAYTRDAAAHAARRRRSRPATCCGCRFTWNVHERLSLKAARLPAPLHLLAGLLAARGLPPRERLAVARFMLRHAPGRLPLAARYERDASPRGGAAGRRSPCASSGSRFACPRSTRRPPRHRRRCS